MALATIFIKKLKGPQFNVTSLVPNQDDAEAFSQLFEVDCSVQETYDHSADITDNPVETGLDVTDHYQPRPTAITMSLVHSDSPIRLRELVAGAITSIGQQAGNVVAGGLGRTAGAYAVSPLAALISLRESRRTKTAYDQFVNMVKKGAVFEVITGLSVYPNLMISNMTVTRDRNTGQALSFTLTMREVRFVTAEEIEGEITRIVSTDDRSRQQKALDQGQQSGKDVSPQKTSAARAFFKFIGV